MRVQIKKERPRGRSFHSDPREPDALPARATSYSLSVSNDALPPAAVVLIVSVRSVAKRSR